MNRGPSSWGARVGRQASFTIIFKKHEHSWRLGFRPRPHWGAYSTPIGPLTVGRGLAAPAPKLHPSVRAPSFEFVLQRRGLLLNDCTWQPCYATEFVYSSLTVKIKRMLYGQDSSIILSTREIYSLTCNWRWTFMYFHHISHFHFLL